MRLFPTFWTLASVGPHAPSSFPITPPCYVFGIRAVNFPLSSSIPLVKSRSPPALFVGYAADVVGELLFLLLPQPPDVGNGA